jgi:2-polyprenyl-6-methoxyphenol hydroxylase-like FAD-dependent oxidoreductase
MNGLLTAAALAPHFEKVTVLDRAESLAGAGPRRQVPQGNHAHVLLTSGSTAVERLLPGFGEALRAAGAQQMDQAADAAWFHAGVWKLGFESGFRPYLMSRPLLESCVRALALALPNVTLQTGVKAEGLVVEGGRVTGLEVSGAPSGVMSADLVVDATGRATQLPAWLAKVGFLAPPEEVVELGLGYVSATFRRDPAVERAWKMLIVYPKRPDHRRGALMMPIEGDRWLLSLSGYAGDHPPLDRAGLLEWMKTLDRPEPWEVVKDLELLDDPVRYLIPTQTRRHFERLSRMPEGLIGMGDVLCALDPVFGQGMSVGAQEAVLLSELLAVGSFTPRRFYARAAKIIDSPWLIANSEAFRFPTTRGSRPFGAALPVLHGFLGRVFEKCADDPVVGRAFIAVMSLEKSAFSLFDPRILARLALPLDPRVNPAVRLSEVKGAPEAQPVPT